MKNFFVRLQAWHDEHNQVAHEALLENLSRLPWILAAMLPLLGLGWYLAWGGHANPNPAITRWSGLIGWMDLVMLLGLSALLMVVRWRKLNERVTPLSRLLPGVLASLFVGFGLTLSTLSQWFLPSATMYVLSCVFAGTLLLIRPSIMALIYLTSLAIFYTVLGHTVTTWGVLVIMCFHGGLAAALGMCLSLLLWRRYTLTELLHRQVQAQGLALEAQNAELALQKIRLETLSHHDPLTGLLNRRAFEIQADMALSRARRDGTGLAVIMLDLDHFKRVNDQHGHPAGDAAIKFMARVIQSSVRDTDLAARVGGEEFMLLLPATSALAAGGVAEKIRQRVALTSIEVGGDLTVRVTISAGVTAWEVGHVGSFEDLYAAADAALYAAKRAGRNRVMFSDGVAHAQNKPVELIPQAH
ncbi:MAG: hypothetical protein FD135_726 [Comamonadaceae bacterium]|nr:MAG: hypothetical protein FD135_726 [Comamonadaceae bacterium]